ncbi:MAG: Xaa-Pro peptidase family protein, partial [Desulfobacteraceae bacterium]|nr:Xaa-Pro peptidase family protein [Desulfobacteraceae bacterium]
MQDNSGERVLEFQRRLADEKIDMALIHDPDSIFYLTGFWGYLGMEFGRPTILIVPQSGPPTLVTPGMEAEMAASMTWVEDIREWTDGIDGEWRTLLENLIESSKYQTAGVENSKIHPTVFNWVKHKFSESNRKDISGILSDMRMVKSPEDLDTMRQAGQVAVAMCDAAVETIAEGVPEYEISLAALNAGTRRAAELIGTKNGPSHFSPMIHNLQVLQSGPNLSMVHGRPTLRRIEKGDPIYMCFCPFTLFKQIKLGFDREFFVGRVSDEHAKIYAIALEAQAAALAMIRPGIPAEEVHFASLAVYQKAGFGICYRTGRGVGYSFLEKPEFKDGDKTPLQAGMTFAVDGGITIPGKFGARVGDSIVVTEDGFEYLTPYPKDL